jgi:hypothetical protein
MAGRWVVITYSLEDINHLINMHVIDSGLSIGVGGKKDSCQTTFV